MIINKYKNGNYTVKIYKNGTKVRFTNETSFAPKFPENIDIKITDFCVEMCPWCHEGSFPLGIHARLDHPFLKTLHAGTELAIGGGNPISHPKLEDFVNEMSNNGIICNLTINQKSFEKDFYTGTLLNCLNKIYGLGISYSHISKYLINFLSVNPNSVLHVINGLISYDELSHFFNKNIKILILGYKNFRRGSSHIVTNNNEIEKNKKELKFNIKTIFNSFSVVSFDNLAIEQLKIKEEIQEEDFNKKYMGDEGKFTMYIDLVENTFAKNSISKQRYLILPTIEEMFEVIRNEKQIINK